RQTVEVAFRRSEGDLGGADLLGFGQRVFAPASRKNVGGHFVATGEVHRHHRKLQAAAPLQQQHGVVVGNLEERAKVRLGRGRNVDERLTAMADLEHACPRAGKTEEFLLRLLQYL